MADGSIGQMMEPADCQKSAPCAKSNPIGLSPAPKVGSGVFYPRSILSQTKKKSPTSAWQSASTSSPRTRYAIESITWTMQRSSSSALELPARLAFSGTRPALKKASRLGSSAHLAQSFPHPTNYGDLPASPVHAGRRNEHRADAQRCTPGGREPHPRRILRSPGRHGALPRRGLG